MKDEKKAPKPYGAPKFYESVLGAPFAILGGLALVIAIPVLGKELLIYLGYIS